MSTLSVQVRLGITRGWRVRTLNEFKFYNQAVAHCLFIFSALRARGYRDRIWTMHYTVFMSGKKYSIYIEYFLLPDFAGWKRGRQRQMLLTYELPRKMISGSAFENEFLNGEFRYAFKAVGDSRAMKPVRRAIRRKTGETVKNALWIWSTRARILDIVRNSITFRQKLTGVKHFHFAELTAHGALSARFGYNNKYKLNIGRYWRLAAAKREASRVRALSLNSRQRLERRWAYERRLQSRKARTTSRYYKQSRLFVEHLLRRGKKLTFKKRALALEIFKRRARHVALARAITREVIRLTSPKGSPEEEFNRLYGIAMLRSRKYIGEQLAAYKKYCASLPKTADSVRKVGGKLVPTKSRNTPGKKSFVEFIRQNRRVAKLAPKTTSTTGSRSSSRKK